MSLAVFQSIGPLELLIVLGIVLIIFGPKRLPSLGRQLGAGMREFKDSISRKSGDDDDDDEQTTPARTAAARRPPRSAAPRTSPSAPSPCRTGSPPSSARRRGASDVDHPAADPARGSPEPRRAPRRAAQAADRLRDRVRRLLRGLPVAGRRRPRHHQPPARAHGVQGQGGLQGPVRAHRRVPGPAAQVGAGLRDGVRHPRARGRGRRPRAAPTSGSPPSTGRWRGPCRRGRRGGP